MFDNYENKKEQAGEEKSENKKLSFLKNKFGGFKKKKDRAEESTEQDIYPLW